MRAEQSRLETWATDYPAFTRCLDIIPRDGQRTKLELNPIQRTYVATRTARDILLKPRQVGITTEELARDVWFFLTRPGARVVVVCQSMTDHNARNELSAKIQVMFQALASEGVVLDFDRESTTMWTLPRSQSTLTIVEAGASEVSAQKKGRGGTVHRLHVTELAFFEHAQATLNALLESVPDPRFGSEVVFESTANGAGGYFFDAYQRAKRQEGAFKAHFFPWFEQPEYATALEPGEVVEPRTERERLLVERHGLTPEQLKWYRAKVADKTQDLVDQEYPSDEDTCWLVEGRPYFDPEAQKILALKTREPIETRRILHGEAVLMLWAKPRPKGVYLIAADPSEGVKRDESAAALYDHETGQHIGTLHGQLRPWDFAGELAKLGAEFNGALIAVERNNHGHAVLDALIESHRYANIFHDLRDGRPGWLNTEVSRARALEALFAIHKSGEFATSCATSASQCRTFVVVKGKPQAQAGSLDDLVLAHAIGNEVLRIPLPKGGTASAHTTHDPDSMGVGI